MSFFTVVKSCKNTSSRLGQLSTGHGKIVTPAFMPIATYGAIKTLSTDEIKKPAKINGTGKIFKDIISGRFLTSEGITSHIPYLLFLTSLFLAYISLGYKFENIERDKMRTERALEEVVSEYKTLRSELESRLQQSRVESATSVLGLQQPISPPTLLKQDAK